MYEYEIELEEEVRYTRVVKVIVPEKDEELAEQKAWDEYRKAVGTYETGEEAGYPWDDAVATDWRSSVLGVTRIQTEPEPEVIEMDPNQNTFQFEQET